MTNQNEFEFIDEEDSELAPAETEAFSQAVLHSADWTVDTIVSQLTRGNIELNPRFQRRDAWSVKRKSAFIESLILGLPVPQIVLAEKKGQRGKYIVLDGKQRLLSLLQFTGNAQGTNNTFRLSGLEARPDLIRKSYLNISADAGLEDDLNAFANYTIRTVVIRNWPNHDFLHIVFLRLNTGSVKLSPQELRQAMFPGEFSNFVDDSAAASRQLQRLLSRDTSDPRMRDVELLVRFLGFHFFLTSYSGRMKDFLDETCESLNNDWGTKEAALQAAVTTFEAAVTTLMNAFGDERIARKEGSKSFNRAIFDALVFYAADDQIREAMQNSPDAVQRAYAEAIENEDFLVAVESDTAGVPNTLARLRIWGELLRGALQLNFNIPTARPASTASRAGVDFAGFWG